MGARRRWRNHKQNQVQIVKVQFLD